MAIRWGFQGLSFVGYFSIIVHLLCLFDYRKHPHALFLSDIEF
jgi:hypothetical protein